MTEFGTIEEPMVDAIKAAHAIVRHPAVRSVVERGFEARDQALRAQTALLAALNLPTAEELATVAARLRSLSQRLESLEDAVERVDQNVHRLAAAERKRAAVATERPEPAE